MRHEYYTDFDHAAEIVSKGIKDHVNRFSTTEERKAFAYMEICSGAAEMLSYVAGLDMSYARAVCGFFKAQEDYYAKYERIAENGGNYEATLLDKAATYIEQAMQTKNKRTRYELESNYIAILDAIEAISEYSLAELHNGACDLVESWNEPRPELAYFEITNNRIKKL